MDEILVNANPSGRRPAILGLGSDFVVIWTDKFGRDLKGARFLASGAKEGDDFPVNTTPGISGLPVIAPSHPGFVVAWIAAPPAQVLFQRFTVSGVKAGGEIVVSATNVDASLEDMRAPGSPGSRTGTSSSTG